MKSRPAFTKKAALAQLEVVVASTSIGHTKADRGVHSLAQQCILHMQSMPGRTLEPTSPPESDPFMEAFIPQYKVTLTLTLTLP